MLAGKALCSPVCVLIMAGLVPVNMGNLLGLFFLFLFSEEILCA